MLAHLVLVADILLIGATSAAGQASTPINPTRCPYENEVVRLQRHAPGPAGYVKFRVK